MRAAEIVAEQRIAASIAAGDFEALPGRGRPLVLEDDSLVPPEWRNAYRLLRNHGMAPAWIVLAGEIRRDLDGVRSSLAGVDRSDPRRPQAEVRYAAKVRELNRRISSFNLLVPSPRWQLPLIDAERDGRDLVAAARPDSAAAPTGDAALP